MSDLSVSEHDRPEFLPCGACGTPTRLYAGDLWFCPNTSCPKSFVDLSDAELRE